MAEFEVETVRGASAPHPFWHRIRWLRARRMMRRVEREQAEFRERHGPIVDEVQARLNDAILYGDGDRDAS